MEGLLGRHDEDCAPGAVPELRCVVAQHSLPWPAAHLLPPPRPRLQPPGAGARQGAAQHRWQALRCRCLPHPSAAGRAWQARPRWPRWHRRHTPAPHRAWLRTGMQPTLLCPHAACTRFQLRGRIASGCAMRSSLGWMGACITSLLQWSGAWGASDCELYCTRPDSGPTAMLSPQASVGACAGDVADAVRGAGRTSVLARSGGPTVISSCVDSSRLAAAEPAGLCRNTCSAGASKRFQG